MKSIEYPPIEDLDLGDMWSGLDFPPFTFPLSRDTMTVAGSAGAGMLLSGWVVPMIPWIKEQNVYWKAAASIAAGLLGGYLLHDFNRPAAAGLTAGMVGMGLATVVAQFTKTPTALAEGAYKEADLLGLGLEDAVVDEETLLTGLDQGKDEDLFGTDEDVLLGDAETEIVAPYELTGLF